MHTFSVLPDIAEVGWMSFAVFTVLWLFCSLVVLEVSTDGRSAPSRTPNRETDQSDEGRCTCGCRRRTHEHYGRGSHCRTCGREVCPKLRLTK